MRFKMMLLLTILIPEFFLLAQPQTAPKKEYEVKIIKNQEVQFIDKTTRAVVKTFNVNERKPFVKERSAKEIMDEIFINSANEHRKNFFNLKNYSENNYINIIGRRSNFVSVIYTQIIENSVEIIAIRNYVVIFDSSGEILFEGTLPYGLINGNQISISNNYNYIGYITIENNQLAFTKLDVMEMPKKCVIFSIKENKIIYTSPIYSKSTVVNGPVFYDEIMGLKEIFNYSTTINDSLTEYLVDLKNKHIYSYKLNKNKEYKLKKGFLIIYLNDNIIKKVNIYNFTLEKINEY